jgi:flagellar biosynthesis/type III secretory pathway M-ring protein FliF/YscJ
VGAILTILLLAALLVFLTLRRRRRRTEAEKRANHIDATDKQKDDQPSELPDWPIRVELAGRGSSVRLSAQTVQGGTVHREAVHGGKDHGVEGSQKNIDETSEREKHGVYLYSQLDRGRSDIRPLDLALTMNPWLGDDEEKITTQY